jgi:hypothetical protein
MTLQTNITRLKEMINSCFTYGGADLDSYNFTRYILPYKENMPAQIFETEYKKHLDFLKSNAVIKHGVYSDHEGCTYNSLIIK